MTQTIGLLFDDILNPFDGAIARDVGDTAGAFGYALTICNISEDPSKKAELLAHAAGQSSGKNQPCARGANAAAINTLQASGIATVQIDRCLPGFAAGRVVIDYDTGEYWGLSI